MKSLSLILLLNLFLAISANSQAQQPPADTATNTATATAPTPGAPLTQDQLVAEIMQLGGVVKTEGDAPADVLDFKAWAQRNATDAPTGAVVGISFTYTHKHTQSPAGKTIPPYDVTDDMVAQFAKLPKLTHLEMSMCPQVTDVGVAHLKGMTQLQFLSLAGTKVTDAGMLNLAGLTNLKFLRLGSTHITNPSLVNLEGMKGLESLWINETVIGDEGMTHLKGLTQLQAITMWGNNVGDAGLEQLKGLTSLQSVRLSGHESRPEIQAFSQALPKCRVWH